jgi:mRNA-degrading endonuclease RelE of RelBE toxin-antitoxin system
MKYRILYTEEAACGITKLDKAVKERVGKAIVRLSEHRELGKPLTGLLSDRWSYRVATGGFSIR